MRTTNSLHPYLSTFTMTPGLPLGRCCLRDLGFSPHRKFFQTLSPSRWSSTPKRWRCIPVPSRSWRATTWREIWRYTPQVPHVLLDRVGLNLILGILIETIFIGNILPW